MSLYGKLLGEVPAEPFRRLGRIFISTEFMRKAVTEEGSLQSKSLKLLFTKVAPLSSAYDLVSERYEYIVASYGDELKSTSEGAIIPFYSVLFETSNVGEEEFLVVNFILDENK